MLTVTPRVGVRVFVGFVMAKDCGDGGDMINDCDVRSCASCCCKVGDGGRLRW